MTSRIMAALVVSFIVFVTVKGELPAYLAVVGLVGGGGQPATLPGGLPAKGSPGNPGADTASGFPSAPTVTPAQ